MGVGYQRSSVAGGGMAEGLTQLYKGYESKYINLTTSFEHKKISFLTKT